MILKSELAQIGINLVTDRKKLSYSTDSRTYKGEELFIALKGEKFDAFAKVSDEIVVNAKVIIYQKSEENDLLAKKYLELNPALEFAPVTDVLGSLQRLASTHRKNWGKLVIGITGSNGKTTTKEMLGHIFSKALGEDKVYYTKGNFNNHFGVPFSLLEIDESHEIAIIEMGTSGFGEIKSLSDIVMPDVGYISNIGDSHLEFLKNREGVFREKSELYKGVLQSEAETSFFLVNAADDYLKVLSDSKRCISAGDKDCDYQIEMSSGGVRVTGENCRVELTNKKIVGKHNYLNLAFSFILSLQLLGEDYYDELVDAAENFCPTKNRSSLLDVGGMKVFLDAYNANPTSMKASLSGFSEYLVDEGIDLAGVAFVIGAMMELGETSDLSHQKIYDYAHGLGAENLFFVGNEFEKKESDSAVHFENVEELKTYLKKSDKVYDAMFIKGSRTLQLELLLDIYSS